MSKHDDQLRDEARYTQTYQLAQMAALESRLLSKYEEEKRVLQSKSDRAKRRLKIIQRELRTRADYAGNSETAGTGTTT